MTHPSTMIFPVLAALTLVPSTGEAAPCEVVPLHQYFSAGSLDHMYTSDWESMGRDSGAGGYTWQGIEGYGCANAAPGTTPLYEYIRNQGWPYAMDTNHYYSTTYWGNTISDPVANYVYTGVVMHVYSSNAANREPLAQYYSHDISGTGHRDHFYTTNDDVYLDPSWGFDYQGNDGYLRMGHGQQIASFPADGSMPVFYTSQLTYELWYPSNGYWVTYQECVDPSSPDFGHVYTDGHLDRFIDGRHESYLYGDDCYLRRLGVKVDGTWYYRTVAYEGPLSFSY